MIKSQSKQRPVKRSHQWIDARDLKMARLIVKKIRRDPSQFEEAVKTLRHWKRTLRPVPHAILEWDQIFARNTREEVLRIFTQDSEEGQRLRQSDPFCGILTEEERLQFLRQYEEE
jgi:hypothetical protein